jgi:iron complex outermembrane receptor protein
MKTMFRMAFLMGSVSALAMPQIAYAQRADTEEARDEILVMATRDARSLQEVSMAVDVATGDDLEKLRIFDVKDIQQLSPGLELTNNSGRNNTASLRGVSFDPDQGTSPSVQVYFNEAPIDAQTAFTAMYDVSQIEVLRGPQGLLRGETAPAGSITIATRRPDFGVVEGYAQASLTSRGGHNLQGGFTLPLGETFALRVAGLTDGNRINHVRNINRGGERSKSRTWSGRATLGWKPNDRFEAYLTYQHLDADNQVFTQVTGAGNTPFGIYGETFGTPSIFVPSGFGGGPFAVNTAVRSGPAITVKDRLAVSEGPYRVKLNSDIVNLAFDWDLGAVKLAFVGNHQRAVANTLRDQDYGNAIPGYQQLNPVHVPYNVDTQELRLDSSNSEGFGWGVSVYHRRQKGLVTNNSTNDLFLYAVSPTSMVRPPNALVGLPGAGFAPFLIGNQLGLQVAVDVPLNIETFSYNAHLRYSSGPLRIEGGLRYSTRKNVQTTQIGLSGLQTVAKREVIPAHLQDIRSKPWTGGFNINYALSDTLNAYAAYGRSNRGGSTGVSTPIGITDDLARTTEEKTNSYEIGLKGSALDRKLNFSLAAYYQKLNGYIRRLDGIFYNAPANQPTTGFFYFNYNGDATIKGVEGTLDAHPTPNWDVNLSASYSRARFSNARLPCNDFAGTGIPNQNGAPKVTGTGNTSYCLTNGRLAEVPDFSLTANTEIRFPMGSVTPYVRALLTHRPGFFSDLAQFHYQSRQLLNMFVGVRGPEDKWSVDVFARNLFNQQRISNMSVGNATLNATVSGAFDSGYRTINSSTPREFGLTAAVKF